MKVHLLLAPLVLLSACAGDEAADDVPNVGETEVVEIPASLAPFGDGYPDVGDPCRQLGESDATSNWLDDSALLVGCPSASSAASLGGTVVDTMEGVTIVSVPVGHSNGGMGDEDALVAGTDYNATTTLDCGFGGAAATQSCEAGVKRNWGDDGTTLVEVMKPDGTRRALYFDGTTPTGADGSQADGSAGWDFKVSRDSDVNTVTFGPETYVIVDAFVEGG